MDVDASAGVTSKCDEGPIVTLAVSEQLLGSSETVTAAEDEGSDIWLTVRVSSNGKEGLVVGVEEVENEKVELKSKLDIFPNPVNDIANIAFATGSNSKITINVVDLQGKVVQSKDLGRKPAGKHRTNINTHDLPSGMYLVKVTAGKTSKTAKFIKM